MSYLIQYCADFDGLHLEEFQDPFMNDLLIPLLKSSECQLLNTQATSSVRLTLKTKKIETLQEIILS